MTGLYGKILHWVSNKINEDELKSLTDRDLRDIGLTRYDLFSKVRTSSE